VADAVIKANFLHLYHTSPCYDANVSYRTKGLVLPAWTTSEIYIEAGWTLLYEPLGCHRSQLAVMARLVGQALAVPESAKQQTLGGGHPRGTG
jgi:hypothetical protein